MAGIVLADSFVTRFLLFRIIYHDSVTALPLVKLMNDHSGNTAEKPNQSRTTLDQVPIWTPESIWYCSVAALRNYANQEVHEYPFQPPSIVIDHLLYDIMNAVHLLGDRKSVV